MHFSMQSTGQESAACGTKTLLFVEGLVLTCAKMNNQCFGDYIYSPVHLQDVH